MAEGDDKAGRVRHFGVFWGVAKVAFVWCCWLLASSLSASFQMNARLPAIPLHHHHHHHRIPLLQPA